MSKSISDSENHMKEKFTSQFHFNELYNETLELLKSVPNYYNSLFKLIILDNIIEFIFLIFYRMFLVVYKFAGPFLTAIFINKLEELEKIDLSENINQSKRSQISKEIFFYGIVIFAIVYTKTLFEEEFKSKKNIFFLRIRCILYCGTYEKLLKSSQEISQFEKEPNILNVYIYDIQKIENGTDMMIESLGILSEIIIGIFYLSYNVKSLAFSGFSLFFILILINIAFVSWSQLSNNQLAIYKDQRISLIQEVFNGIKQIKLLNWENIFWKKIIGIRNQEFSKIRYVRYLDALLNFFDRSASLVIMTVLISSLDNYKEINIYSILVLSNLLVHPITAFPWYFGSAFGTYFSYNRIQKILHFDEIYKINEIKNEQENKNITIKIDNFNFNYENEKPLFNIKNLIVQKGSYILLIGKNGTGKTTFLKLLLGEIINEDNIYINGSLAYVAQNSWLMKGTIKENILFGEQFDNNKYNECVELCELGSDLNEKNPELDIGLNGCKLSGGQRQRIALCRAIYQNKDIYLLDDVFSSIDEIVSHKIFNKCILQYLKKNGKTIILTNTHEKFTNNVSQIYEFNNKKLISYKNSVKKDNSKEKIEQNTSLNIISDKINFENLISDEENEEEDEIILENETIIDYIKSMGSLLFIIILIISLFQQLNKHFNEIWINSFIKAKLNNNDFSNVFLFNNDYEYTIKILSLIFGFITLLRGFIYAFGILKSAKNYFKNLLTKLINGELSFFDKYNIGEIMNHFTKDIEVLDCNLPEELNAFFSISIAIIGLLTVIIYEIPILIIVVVYIVIKMKKNYLFYSIVNRRLKFSIKKCESNLNTHLIETLNGLITIRAFNKENYFKEKFEIILKDFLLFPSIKDFLNRMTVLRITMLTSILTAIILAVTLISISIFSISVKSSIIGLSLSYSFLLAKLMVDLVCSSVNLESEFSHVKNIIDVMQKTNNQPEKSIETQNKSQLNKLKLNNIIISFQNVYMNYDQNKTNNHYALKNISFDIKKNSKIAFCGTTGSGKTSIFNILMKIYSFEKGKIFLNGQNIKEIKNEDLREKMSIIPQLGFLFKGSLKENIDPSNKFGDKKILEMIKSFNLENLFEKLSNENNLLSKKIETNGNNLSNGEKQVINFLQNMMFEKDLILLDEATSNLDENANNTIMKALFKYCENKTLIMISHKLDYLKEFDMIFVLNSGEIIEKGPYNKLIEEEHSHFNKLRKSCAKNK